MTVFEKSVCDFFEFFTQSSLNLNAVSQHHQSLGSLPAVSQQSLSSLLALPLKSLSHAPRTVKSAAYIIIGGELLIGED